MRKTLRYLTAVLPVLALCVGLSALSFPGKEAAAIADSADPLKPIGNSWSIKEKVKTSARARAWADSVMARMSLKEKVCQLFVYTIAPDRTKSNEKLLDQVVTDYKVGGLLFSGGELENQAILTNQAQSKADVPLMICFDGEWGLAMRLKQTPSYPRNRVLGSIAQDTLIEAYGYEVARQLREIGVTVNFAPDADVDNNPKNPVINTRSFGEQPWNVADKVIAYSRGLERGGVLAVAKHFPGHGDTDTDSHKALPTLPFDRQRLDSVELRPFRESIKAGVSGVMVGHLDVPALTNGSGKASSVSRDVVMGLLKEEIGFEGLTFTDALVMGGLAGNSSVCLKALQAGNDMLLVPPRIKEELNTILSAIKRGDVSEDYIDEKCRKVLMYKYVLGLTTKPQIRMSGLMERVRTDYAMKMVDDLYGASTIVLKNENSLLPLSQKSRVALVSASGAASAYKSLTDKLEGKCEYRFFQLAQDKNTWSQLKKELAEYDKVLLLVPQTPQWDYSTFFLASPALEKPYAVVSFSSVKDSGKYPAVLDNAGSVIIAHINNASQQELVAGLLLGDAKASGRLPIAVAGYPAGTGVRYPQTVQLALQSETQSETQAQDREPVSLVKGLEALDAIVEDAIAQQAFPGCQIVVLQKGQVIYDKAFGKHTYKGDQKVRPTDLYDLASLTKTTATLLAVMKLYDQGKISVTDKASKYLNYLAGTNKRNITVRDLLLHESGLPASISFYLEAVDKESYSGKLMVTKKDASHPVQVAATTWANPDFSFMDGLTSSVRTDKHSWQVSDGLWIDPDFRLVYHQKIVDAKLGSKRYLYSDLNFLLLQEIVEVIAQEPLDEYLNREFYVPMGLTRTLYKPLDRIAREEIVPTVQEDLIRKQLLQGYVHDEAAAFLGGVSGNAGLFSNALEVSSIYQMLLDGGIWQGKRLLSESTVRYFTTTKSRISRRGLGFDKPEVGSPKSPCADSAPASVYGHTGFTGTCAWVDPDNELVLVFLSNRVHPNPWVNKVSSLNIRPRLQQAMYDALVK